MTRQTITKRLLQVIISGGILIFFCMVAVAAIHNGVYTFAIMAVVWGLGSSMMTFFLIGRKSGAQTK